MIGCFNPSGMRLLSDAATLEASQELLLDCLVLWTSDAAVLSARSKASGFATPAVFLLLHAGHLAVGDSNGEGLHLLQQVGVLKYCSQQGHETSPIIRLLDLRRLVRKPVCDICQLLVGL